MAIGSFRTPIYSGGAAPLTSGDYVVRFFDYDGTILKIEYVNSGNAATAPITPTHSLLTFNSWNRMFSNVTEDIDVGAIYDTADGKSHIFITLTVPTGLTHTLRLKKTTGDEMTINWGDDSSDTDSTNGNITKTHTYAAAGDYVITIECSGNYGFGQGSTTTAIFYNDGGILTKLFIGSSVTDIGNYAFYLSLSLKNITIPNGVTSIGISSFSLCPSLKNITIPNGVTSIANSAFTSCPSLQDIQIADSVTSIGNDVFRACSVIRHIKIPDGCVVGTDFCETNYSLGSFIFKSGQESVGNDFFNGCSSLESVYLPSTITSIADDAFAICPQIKTLEILASVPPTLNAGAFDQYSKLLKIYVPAANVDDYKTAANWNTLADYIHPIPT